MRTKLFRLLLAVLTTINFGATHAFAGAESSGGGHGVRMQDGQIRLYDFVEMGIDSPDLGQADEGSWNLSPACLLEFQNKLGRESLMPMPLVIQKLRQIGKYDPQLANNVCLIIKNQDWIFVAEAIHDAKDKHPITDIDGRLVPIATQSRKVVTLSKPAFAQLNDSDRVGLVFHELFLMANEAFHWNSIGHEIVVEATVHAIKYVFGGELRAHSKKNIIGKDFEVLFWPYTSVITQVAPGSEKGTREWCSARAGNREDDLSLQIDTRTNIVSPEVPGAQRAEGYLRNLEESIAVPACLRNPENRVRMLATLNERIFTSWISAQWSATPKQRLRRNSIVTIIQQWMLNPR